MPRSKSPKQKSPQVSPDPQMRQRARAALANRSKKKQNILQKYSYHFVFAIFGIAMVWFLISTFWKTGPNVNTTLVNDPIFIQQRNSMKSTFKVGQVKFFKDYKLVDAKLLINNAASNKKQLYICNKGNKQIVLLQQYNFRQQYKQKCGQPIIQQGNCSSSYAIAPISVINDRWCKLNPQQHPILSPQGPLACDKVINKNCKEGFVSRTLDYAKIYGLVQQNCYPYNDHPQSPQKCQNSTQKCPKFKIADYCVSKQEQSIKQQIYNYGPVIAVIPIYRDFLIYKSGVYSVSPGTHKFSSGHAIKIIGWDVRQGINCWLVQNSWGQDWGQNGFGCIQMNQDELGIQQFTLAVALNNEQIQGSTTEQININQQQQSQSSQSSQQQQPQQQQL